MSINTTAAPAVTAESALRARRLILGGGRVQARFRDQIVRLIPERLLERSIRRVIDAERPLAHVPVSGVN